MPAVGEGRAGEQPHLPGGYAAALRHALPASQSGLLRYREDRQGHAGADVVARQQLPPAEGAGISPAETGQSGLGALSGPAEMARLGSAAILQLARVPGFRRRASN